LFKTNQATAQAKMQVDKRIVVEKDFAYHRDLAQQRNRNLLEALHAFDGSNQLLEQQITHAHSKR
jgi:hypothetical protein